LSHREHDAAYQKPVESIEELTDEQVEREEVTPAYACFASNMDSSYITGEVLTLLGGNTTASERAGRPTGH
jgi:hypothetical protein